MFMRELVYADAINEALHQILESDKKAILLGQGVTSPWYVGTTTRGLNARFGDKRVIDTPVSECAITGAAVGAALAGLHPIVEHPRMDFMYYAMDPIANHAACWSFMFDDQAHVPMIIWGIINRGGEQAAQHSQSLHALFTHIPGLRVVMPSTPYDAKGLLIAGMKENNPVMFIDDRWLYPLQGEVPEEMYEVPIGKGKICRSGRDISIIASSWMVHESLEAAKIAEKEGIDAEVIDVRSLKPLDENLIFSSVRKTGRVIIADGGWRTCGFAAEVSARIAEQEFFLTLKAPVTRITLPDFPAPASKSLELRYYKKASDIVSTIRAVMRK
jgi:pyruvate dehydrogenase E1 component beta subunit